MSIAVFPTINASLNFLAGVFLFFGWLAIRQKNHSLHRLLMMAALTCSTLFLVCYVTYHAMKQGVVTHYQGQGLSRFIYFLILSTHTVLAVIIVPFCLQAVRHALKGEFSKHTSITRWLYPVWVYVSITGVVIYFMLYIF